MPRGYVFSYDPDHPPDGGKQLDKDENAQNMHVKTANGNGKAESLHPKDDNETRDNQDDQTSQPNNPNSIPYGSLLQNGGTTDSEEFLNMQSGAFNYKDYFLEQSTPAKYGGKRKLTHIQCTKSTTFQNRLDPEFLIAWKTADTVTIQDYSSFQAVFANGYFYNQYQTMFRCCSGGDTVNGCYQGVTYGYSNYPLQPGRTQASWGTTCGLNSPAYTFLTSQTSAKGGRIYCNNDAGEEIAYKLDDQNCNDGPPGECYCNYRNVETQPGMTHADTLAKAQRVCEPASEGGTNPAPITSNWRDDPNFQHNRRCEIFFDCTIKPDSLAYYTYESCENNEAYGGPLYSFVEPAPIAGIKPVEIDGSQNLRISLARNYKFRICVQGDTDPSYAPRYMVKESGWIFKTVQVCGYETLVKIGSYSKKVLPVSTNNGDFDMTQLNTELDNWYTFTEPHQTGVNYFNCKELKFVVFEDITCHPAKVATDKSLYIDKIGSQSKLWLTTTAWYGLREWCVEATTLGEIPEQRDVTIEVICGTEQVVVDTTATQFVVDRLHHSAIDVGKKKLVYDRDVTTTPPVLVTENFNDGSWNLKGVFYTKQNTNENQYTFSFGEGRCRMIGDTVFPADFYQEPYGLLSDRRTCQQACEASILCQAFEIVNDLVVPDGNTCYIYVNNYYVPNAATDAWCYVKKDRDVNNFCPIVWYELMDRDKDSPAHALTPQSATQTQIVLADNTRSMGSMTIDVSHAQRYHSGIRAYSKGYDEYVALQPDPSPLVDYQDLTYFNIAGLYAQLNLDITVCGLETLSHDRNNDGSTSLGDVVDLVWQQPDAPLYEDISRWFAWDIPGGSTDECVDYEGLYQPVLSFDCAGPHEISPEEMPFWLDTGDRTTHEEPWEDRDRYTNARIKISKLKPFPQTDCCVKILTRGKIWITRQFRIELCGGEVVSRKPGTRSIRKVWTMKTTEEGRADFSYEQFVPQELYKEAFEVNSEFCPITQFDIYERKNVATDGSTVYGYVPFLNPPLSYNGAFIQEDPDDLRYTGDGGILVNTQFNFTYDNLYVRAATENANFPAFLPLVLKVCGFEEITPIDNDPEKLNMVRRNNAYFEKKTSLLDYFQTNDLACFVDSFALINEEKENDEYVWLDEDMNLVIDTATYFGEGNITFTLQGTSIGGVSGEKDFILYVHNTNSPPTFGPGGGEDGRLVNCRSPGATACSSGGLDEFGNPTHIHDQELRIVIRVTAKDRVEGFGDNEVFDYESPKVTDKENNNIVMAFSGHRSGFAALQCGCIEVYTDLQDMFKIKAFRPALTEEDEGRYYFTITLTDDSGYQKSTHVGVYVDVIVEDIPPNLESNCTARITSIDRWGHAVVEFNHHMQPIYNHTWINQTILDLYVKPAYGREWEETFNVSDLNFTWYAPSLRGNRLDLMLSFYKPFEISPGGFMDILKVHFKQDLYKANRTCGAIGPSLGWFAGPEECKEIAQARTYDDCAYFMHASAHTSYFPKQECFCCLEEDNTHLWTESTYDEDWNVYYAWWLPQWVCTTPVDEDQQLQQQGRRRLEQAAALTPEQAGIHPNYTTIQRKIPRQLEGDDSRRFIDSMGALLIVIKSIFLLSLALSYFLSGSLQFIIGMVNSLQIIVHLPLLAVIMPANVVAVYQILIPIATFDFIPSEFFDAFFTFDAATQEGHDERVRDQAAEMGYENHNAMQNLNTIGVLIFLFHIKVAIMMAVCRPLSRKKEKCAKCYDMYLNSLVFTEVIVLLVEGYFELLIAGYLNFKLPLMTTNGEGWGTAVGHYCLFLALFVLPSLLLWMMFQSITYINSAHFRKLWRGLYWGVNPTRKWTLLYTVVFIVRRTLFVSVAFNMIDLPCQQVQMIMFMNVLVYMYDADAYPMSRRLRSHVELFNEMTITIVTAHLLCYTDWVVSQENQYSICGWSHIYFMLQNLLFNCILVGYILWHQLVLFLRRYWPGFKAWLRRFLWDRFKTRWNCLEDEPGESWWSQRCRKDPDAESLADKLRALLCFAKPAPKKKKKKKKKSKKKVKKKKFNLVEESIVTFREPEESSEEDVVEQKPVAPSLLDKVLACFLNKKEEPPPSPPVEEESEGPPPFQTDHLSMFTGGYTAPTQQTEDEPDAEAGDPAKKGKKKRVKQKKKKMKWVYVQEQAPEVIPVTDTVQNDSSMAFLNNPPIKNEATPRFDFPQRSYDNADLNDGFPQDDINGVKPNDANPFKFRNLLQAPVGAADLDRLSDIVSSPSQSARNADGNDRFTFREDEDRQPQANPAEAQLRNRLGGGVPIVSVTDTEGGELQFFNPRETIQTNLDGFADSSTVLNPDNQAVQPRGGEPFRQTQLNAQARPLDSGRLPNNQDPARNTSYQPSNPFDIRKSDSQSAQGQTQAGFRPKRADGFMDGGLDAKPKPQLSRRAKRLALKFGQAFKQVIKERILNQEFSELAQQAKEEASILDTHIAAWARTATNKLERQPTRQSVARIQPFLDPSQQSQPRQNPLRSFYGE